MKATVTICYSTSVDVEVEFEQNEPSASIIGKAVEAVDDKKYDPQLLHNLRFWRADITDTE